MSAARRLGLFLPAVLVVLVASTAAFAAAAETPGEKATQDLFLLVLVPALGIGILVQALIVYAVLRFRRRGGHTEPPSRPKTHDSKLEAAWTIIPAIILLVVGLATFQTLVVTDTVPEDPDVIVTATGQQWFWRFSVFDVAAGTYVNTTGDFTVQVGQTVKLVLEAVDVAHAVWIPAFGLKVDALPGHENVYWFQALSAGDFELYCAEFCGLNHYAMAAVVHVVA
jgi:cytochrome c oxidase subunit 2